MDDIEIDHVIDITDDIEIDHCQGNATFTGYV